MRSPKKKLFTDKFEDQARRIGLHKALIPALWNFLFTQNATHFHTGQRALLKKAAAKKTVVKKVAAKKKAAKKKTAIKKK